MKVSTILFLLASTMTASLAYADGGSLGVGQSLQSDGAEIDVTAIQTCDTPSTAAMRDLFMPADGMSCQTRDKIENDFDSATIGITAATAYAACTGVGAPISVSLGTLAAVTSIVQFVVKNLPCDDSQNQARVQAQIKTAVCDALNKQGITCNDN